MATRVERRRHATLVHEGWARGHLRPLDIRKGDNVVVLSGKDKGKRGVVELSLIHISSQPVRNAWRAFDPGLNWVIRLYPRMPDLKRPAPGSRNRLAR